VPARRWATPTPALPPPDQRLRPAQGRRTEAGVTQACWSFEPQRRDRHPAPPQLPGTKLPRPHGRRLPAPRADTDIDPPASPAANACLTCSRSTVQGRPGHRTATGNAAGGRSRPLPASRNTRPVKIPVEVPPTGLRPISSFALGHACRRWTGAPRRTVAALSSDVLTSVPSAPTGSSSSTSSATCSSSATTTADQRDLTC